MRIQRFDSHVPAAVGTLLLNRITAVHTREQEQRAEHFQRYAELDAEVQLRVAQAWLTYRQASAQESSSRAGDVVELAVVLAEQIVRAEVSARPELLSQWVQQAADSLGAAHAYRVLVSAGDADILRAQDSSLTVDVVDELAPGDVILAAKHAQVDARVSVKLAALKQALERRLADDTRGSP